MAFDSKGLDDYIDVAQRIVEFRAKFPEGSLQPANPAQPFEIRQIAGTDKNGKEQSGTFIIYTAAAYRNPDDPRPGIGCAYEVFPGRTPYTAGSELQNAETAAWGRAIVAALAADTRAGIASQQEVRNRQAERSDAGAAFENAAPAQPRQNGSGEKGPQGSGNWSKWLASAVEVAPKHASLDACRAAWKRSSELVAEGKLSGPQVEPLQALLRKRMEELKGEPKLSDDDPWVLKVEELNDDDDAFAAISELADALSDGTVDETKFRLVSALIEAKFPATGQAAAA